MDFSTIDLEGNAARGADCHIDNPVTGEPMFDDNGKPITIRVLGADSKEFRRALQKQIDVKGPKTLEQSEKRAVELLVPCVTAWSGIVWEGEPLECTPDNVRMFLTKLRPIRQQLDAFQADRGNFAAS